MLFLHPNLIFSLLVILVSAGFNIAFYCLYFSNQQQPLENSKMFKASNCLKEEGAIYVQQNWSVLKSTKNSTTSTRELIVKLKTKYHHLSVPIPNFLFFNAIPKTGSQSMEHIIKNLKAKNKLVFRKEFIIEERNYGVEKQRLRCISNMINYQRFMAGYWTKGLVLDQHLHFVDCTRFGIPNPTYFTTIRDPFSAFVSNFPFRRLKPGGFKVQKLIEPGASTSLANWWNKSLNNCILTKDPECIFTQGARMDRPIAYFCGTSHHQCQRHGSRNALEVAKANIEQWFPVVPVLEERNLSLRVMEAKIPIFFKHIFLVPKLDVVHNQGPPGLEPVSPEAKDLMVKNIPLEYELYNFLLNRLRRQASDLGLTH